MGHLTASRISTRDAKYDGRLLPLSMSREAFKDIESYARLPRLFLQVLHRRAALHIRTTPTLPPVVRIATRWLAQHSRIPKASTDEYIRKKINDEYLSKASKRRCEPLRRVPYSPAAYRFRSPN